MFEPGDAPGAGKAGKAGSGAPITINQEILRAAGLVSTLKKPLKVLGNGDLDVALFVVADAFSRSAISKIEAAGGSIQVLEVPSEPLAALGLELLEPESPSASSDDPADGHDHPTADSTDAESAPAEPVAKPSAKTAAKTTAKATAKPATKAAAKPAAKATAKTPAKTTAKATAKTTAKSAAGPAPKSAAKPAKQPAKDA